MILSNGRFTHARFTSSQKDQVESIWFDEENETYEQVAIDINLENPLYVKLLETFTTDEISMMTDTYAREEQENFFALVKSIAEDNGLIYNPDAEVEKDKLEIDHIFNPPEGNDGEDLLFDIKLKIFDMQTVSDSENTELKKQLREADSPLKALYIAGKFLYE